MYSCPQKGIPNRTASPITEERSHSEAVFSHLSKCSRKTWYCLAVMHDRWQFPTPTSKCGY
ncbi:MULTISPECIES: hypothetical protein [unclassified Microcoleus]|uniref:hypothetical protein n=1 Tax=unclassified Microcoleus TaxID=2642155 RepID=UPI002FD01617